MPAHADPRGRTYVPWGMLAAIDLHGCERSQLEDPDTLRRFVPSLIDAIGMRAHGPLALDRFGDGELKGWSAMQAIEIYYCLVNGAIAVLIHHRRGVLGSLEPSPASRSFRHPRRWVRSAVRGSGPRTRIGSGTDDPVGAAPSMAAQRVGVVAGEEQGGELVP